LYRHHAGVGRRDRHRCGISCCPLSGNERRARNCGGRRRVTLRREEAECALAALAGTCSSVWGYSCLPADISYKVHQRYLRTTYKRRSLLYEMSSPLGRLPSCTLRLIIWVLRVSHTVDSSCPVLHLPSRKSHGATVKVWRHILLVTSRQSAFKTFISPPKTSRCSTAYYSAVIFACPSVEST